MLASYALLSSGGDWFNGMPVYLVDTLCDRVQFRFPRSHKKRIRKKWAKQAKNFRSVPKKEAYLLGGRALMMHPKTFEALKQIHQRELEHKEPPAPQTAGSGAQSAPQSASCGPGGLLKCV